MIQFVQTRIYSNEKTEATKGGPTKGEKAIEIAKWVDRKEMCEASEHGLYVHSVQYYIITGLGEKWNS